MWSPVVVKAYPVADHAAGMLQGFEAMAMRALLFQCADDSLNHAVLLWAVRRDELLVQPIAAHQRGVITRRENKPII